MTLLMFKLLLLMLLLMSLLVCVVIASPESTFILKSVPELASYICCKGFKLSVGRAVVVAQLAEWSLPTLEIRSSNPEIGNILS